MSKSVDNTALTLCLFFLGLYFHAVVFFILDSLLDITEVCVIGVVHKNIMFICIEFDTFCTFNFLLIPQIDASHWPVLLQAPLSRHDSLWRSYVFLRLCVSSSALSDFPRFLFRTLQLMFWLFNWQIIFNCMF